MAQVAGARASPADSPRSCVSPARSQELASTPEAPSSRSSQLALAQPFRATLASKLASFPAQVEGSGDETRLTHGASALARMVHGAWSQPTYLSVSLISIVHHTTEN